MATAQEIFARIEQRETVGEETLKRYEYQKFWCILKIIELYLADDDFGVSLEMCDDVAVVDSVKDVKCIRFYQIKTSVNNQSISFLTSGGNGDGSVAAKGMYMFYCEELDRGLIDSIILVCNFRIRFNKHKNYDRVSVSELCEKDKGKIFDSIKNKYPKAKIEDLNVYSVEYVDIAVNRIEQVVEADLMRLVGERCQGISYDPRIFCRNVVDFVGRSQKAVGSERFVTRGCVDGWLCDARGQEKSHQVYEAARKTIMGMKVPDAILVRYYAGLGEYFRGIRSGDDLVESVRLVIMDRYHLQCANLVFDRDYICSFFEDIVGVFSDYVLHEDLVKGGIIYEREFRMFNAQECAI